MGFSSADQVGIERAHRLGRQGNGSRPIIAQFSNFKDKEAILKKKKDLNQRGSKIYINQDFAKGVRETRKKLNEIRNKMKSDKS